MFKNHLEMIGRNESPSKKARFWQSFVRSLKGSEDIRAEERYRPTRRSVFPELSTSWPYTKSIYDDPSVAAARITVPGYRYLPVHRETYGYSPRNIYAHNYPSRSLDRYRPIYHVPRRGGRIDPFDAHKAWQEHLDRMSAIDRLYPSRYGLYLKDRAYPITDLSTPATYPPRLTYPKDHGLLKGIEYEPDNKPHWGSGADRVSPLREDPFFAEADKWAGIDRSLREISQLREMSQMRDMRARSATRARSEVRELRALSESRAMSPLRGLSPTPVKPRISEPRDCEIAYDADGVPLYNAGRTRRPWADIFNPSPYLPYAAISRDPFWYDSIPELRPLQRWERSPFIRDRESYARNSYLSPVKRNYVWDKHPIRPLDLMLEDVFSGYSKSRPHPYSRIL